MLDRHAIPFIAVDSNAGMTSQARSDGKPVYYGDAARPEYLRRCGLETARAVVVTMDLTVANEAVVETTRRLRPDITLVARARDADHARALYALGVTDAVPETIEASLQLSEAVLVDLGVPMGLVIASIHEKRDEFRKLLASPARPSGRARPAGRGGGEEILGSTRARREHAKRPSCPACRESVARSLRWGLTVRACIENVRMNIKYMLLISSDSKCLGFSRAGSKRGPKLTENARGAERKIAVTCSNRAGLDAFVTPALWRRTPPCIEGRPPSENRLCPRCCAFS